MQILRLSSGRSGWRPEERRRSDTGVRGATDDRAFSRMMSAQLERPPGAGAAGLIMRPLPFETQPAIAGAAVSSASPDPSRPANSGEGAVPGFSKWFQSIPIGGPNAFTWPPAFSATAEGAQEALRLVQEYVPEAKIEPWRYALQIGSTPSHYIVLPDGHALNAGLLLDAYYHQGSGADANSVAWLREELGLQDA